MPILTFDYEKMAEKKAQAEKEARAKKDLEEKIANREKAIAEREEILLGLFGPDKVQGGEGGTIGRLAHVVGLQAENIAYEMICDLFGLGFSLTINAGYIEQVFRHKMAQFYGQQAGKIVFDHPDLEVFPIDPKTGKPDCSKDPIPFGERSREVLEKNNIVPIPSWLEGQKINFLRYVDNTLGDAEQERKKKGDDASDLRSMPKPQPQKLS